MAVSDWIVFLREFGRHPIRVGAIGPSSKALARRMVAGIDWSSVETVIEYGPGTGAFTGEIARAKRAGSRFLAIEFNDRFAAELRCRFPDVRVKCDSVANVQQICAAEGIQAVDVVICGLPWAGFSQSMQVEYLEAMMGVLRKGGVFRTFAYVNGLVLPSALRFRTLLMESFSTCRTTGVIWRNLPPALIYDCQR